MLYLSIILMMILLIILIYCYYYELIKNFCVHFYNIKKKFIFIVLSSLLTILTFDLFDVFGIFLMHFLFISLFFYLISSIIKKIGKIDQNREMLSQLIFIPIILTTIILGYGYINMKRVVERDYVIYTDKEIENDMRVLLVTDVHYETIFDKNELVEHAKKLNDVNADIVILGGDIVDENTSLKGMNDIFAVLGTIKNRYGIFYVTGNHDEQRYGQKKVFDKDILDRVISENNIKIIDDNYYRIKENVIVAGRRDYSYGNRLPVVDILENVNRDDYVIMVDHQPIDYDENMTFGTDLILSGHTHGGQIFPLSFFINLFHTADLSYGHEKLSGMDAIVSSGMAGWGHPIRTEKHSEYVVIDIKMRK